MSRLSGFHLSEETKKKMSISKLGSLNPMFGIKTPKERKDKISRKNKLYWKNHPDQLKVRGNRIKANHKGTLGKHWTLSDETRKRQSLAQRKEKNPAWRGGLTEKNWGFYGTPEYKKWRSEVIRRDGKCVWCGGTYRLEADHIAPRFLYPELRLVVENGRTLCHECHVKTETYRGKNRFKSKNLYVQTITKN